MIHSVRFISVLDTNVIYPVDIRDILLWFAHYDLFTPKWSKHIFDEWEEVMRRKGVSEQEIEKRSSSLSKAFPDALVHNYEPLIESLNLQDPKDRHVLAAAIKTNANLIVTNNISDFPDESLEVYGLSAKKADDFLTDLIDLNPTDAIMAFQEMVLHRQNPSHDELKVLEILKNRGLTETAHYLHALL